MFSENVLVKKLAQKRKLAVGIAMVILSLGFGGRFVLDWTGPGCNLVNAYIGTMPSEYSWYDIRRCEPKGQDENKAFYW